MAITTVGPKQRKFVMILAVLATVALSIVAIFTSIRLQQIGTEPVAPSVPKSKPKAQEAIPTPAANSACLISVDIPASTAISCSEAHWNENVATRAITLSSGGSAVVHSTASGNSTTFTYALYDAITHRAICVPWQDGFTIQGDCPQTPTRYGQPIYKDPVNTNRTTGRKTFSYADLFVDIQDYRTGAAVPVDNIQINAYIAFTENGVVNTTPSHPQCVVSVSRATTVSPTPTPTDRPAATPTPTDRPTATPTPNPTCDSTCASDANCTGGLVCSSGRCRNSQCTSQTNCICPTTPTPTPTPPPSCNSTCTDDSGCMSGLVCSSGRCRNSQCTDRTNCVCPTALAPTAIPTVPQESLPQAGGIGETIGVAVSGIGIILLGLLLLL